MSFKVYESGGSWGVGKDGEGIIIEGTEISYEVYKELRDAPHLAKNRFKRDARGKLVDITKKKVT